MLFRSIVLGIGGSATNDLGLGALEALGLEFLDAGGDRVSPPVPARWREIARIGGRLTPGLPPIRIACDVTNPLLGPRGAAATYGPQKGLRPGDLARLDHEGARIALMAPDGALNHSCRFCYELRLHRARGYGALKAILDVLAAEESLTLTEISVRLRRTPGSTKDYLSWLEDVDLVTSRQKRYSLSWTASIRHWRVRFVCQLQARLQRPNTRRLSPVTKAGQRSFTRSTPSSWNSSTVRHRPR